MIRIGKYRVCSHSHYWVQTYNPTRVMKILFMTIYYEACPTDVDKVQQFPLGIPMEHKGRTYHYRQANSNQVEGK